MTDSPAIEARGLRYSVGDRVILQGIDLEVWAGRSVAITGPSGSGKTTLLMCLAGLLPLTAGQVRIDGRDLASLTATARAALRLRRVGIVYQFGELLPELTTIENVTLPALLHGAQRKLAYSRARALLGDLGVMGLVDTPTATLSGGERQRVAVARALVTSPAVVLADEPTGSLDRAGVDAVSNLLFDLPEKYGCALVVVTHNDHVAARADDHLSLTSGTLVASVSGS